MELHIERPADGPAVVHLTVDADEPLTDVADALALGRNAGDDAPIWLHGSSDERDSEFRRQGYASDRSLLKLRARLPTPPTDLVTRPFRETDIAEFLQVNNRAFDWHPEQGGLTENKLRADMSAPWFDPEGFRLHFRDGRLAGFCWTKIHTSPERIGEIYAIALDPDFIGLGLGKPMTQAGLDWLSSQGLPEAMLYVESDNEPALATYRSLGFEVHRVDKLWRRR